MGKFIRNGNHSFSNAERRYCVTHKELYLLNDSLDNVGLIYWGDDHQSLKWLIKFKGPVYQLARW